jgi:hypothetical protein
MKLWESLCQINKKEIHTKKGFGDLTMEKKAPVKKVLLRKEDEFYVYDKRINKCVKEGCDGLVKYGLNLQVQMPNGDTLNTYECNKCHMKYTAYPNYVRLKDGKHIHIFNYGDVKARDKKRKDDAAKQAKRTKHADFAWKKGFASRKQEHSHKKYNDNIYDRRYNSKRYNNVTTIGGYQKSYEAVFGEDKRVVVDD